MDQPTAIGLRVGAWDVDPVSCQISRGKEVVRVEARTMRLLLCLAARAGEVVSIDEVLDQVWSGVVVTPDSVYQAVTSLRRLLGDDPKRPTYIVTVPRQGYRLIATVIPRVDVASDRAQASSDVKADEVAPTAARRPPTRLRSWGIALGAASVIIVAFAATYLIHDGFESPPQRSIAVLPFLDLTTQGMNEEYFADGLTEELIGELSKVPGLRVAAPTASFYFKGKQVPVAEIARKLRVAYVLDGSVRKSGNVYRVAARLVRANDGYVEWTEAYERPLGDLLEVQKSVAADAVSSIRLSVGNAKGSAPMSPTGARQAR